jgi:hypothetical protein
VEFLVMQNVRVPDISQRPFQPEHRGRVDDELLLSEPRPARLSFHGLFLAVLLSSVFWGGLALLLLRLR